MVTNPCDHMATYFHMLTGDEKVVSLGTMLDSARVRLYLQEHGFRTHAIVCGIHGEIVFVARKTVANVPSNEIEKALEYAKHSPFEIVRHAGMTTCGTGAAITRVVEGLLNRISFVDGLAPLAIDGTAIGVPCDVGGCVKVKWEPLECDEVKRVRELASIVKGQVEDVSRRI